jgi:hypothetical protein
MNRILLLGLGLGLVACEAQPAQNFTEPVDAGTNAIQVDAVANAFKVARTISITPGSATVPYGTAQTYSARVVYSDGSVSTNPSGLIWGTTAVAPNSFTVTAAMNGVTGTAAITVAAPPSSPPPDTTPSSPPPPPPPPPPPAGKYTTGFSLTENPMSEGGLWHHTDLTSMTPVRTASGRAMSSQSGTHGTDDSNAFLTGFGTNYEVEGVLYVSSPLHGNGSEEVEILLRWDDTGPMRQTAYGQTRGLGYEINIPSDGHFMSLSRYKDATSLRDFKGAVAGNRTPQTGDKFRARIEGQRIRVWYNDVLRIDYTDASGITTGNPGIGLFVSGDSPSTDFGFDAVTVTALP